LLPLKLLLLLESENLRPQHENDRMHDRSPI